MLWTINIADQIYYCVASLLSQANNLYIDFFSLTHASQNNPFFSVFTRYRGAKFYFASLCHAAERFLVAISYSAYPAINAAFQYFFQTLFYSRDLSTAHAIHARQDVFVAWLKRPLDHIWKCDGVCGWNLRKKGLRAANEVNTHWWLFSDFLLLSSSFFFQPWENWLLLFLVCSL